VRLVDRDVGEIAEQLRGAVGRDTGLEQVGPFVDEARGRPAGLEGRVGEHRLEEGDVRRHPANPELRQCPARPAHCHREGAAAAGELDEHRVEVRTHLGTDEHRATVQADAAAAGGAVDGDLTGVGTEAVGGVLGRDAALEGEAAHVDVLLADPEVVEGLTGRDAQLGHDEVDVGDLLGDGVLDLDPRVHLDEHVVAVLAEEELHRAGVDVADRLGEADRVGAHPLAGRRVEVGGGCDLDDLLVAPLQGAVPLEEVQDAPGAVGEDLDLDVPRVDDGLLEEEGRVAERRLGLALGRLERLPKPVRAVDATHTAAAAAGDRLDEEGVADPVGGLGERVQVGRRVDTAQGGQAGRPGGADRAGLVAGQVEGGRRRSDEGDAVSCALLGEQRVLGEEAVARVDRVGAALAGDAHDVLVVEVAAHRVALLADLVRLVGLEAMLGVAVLVGEDRDRLRAELGGGAERADGDLASVGDQDLVEHVIPPRAGDHLLVCRPA
jgi:hypothetical protein